MTDSKERIPHADRPAVVREFCTCEWIWAQREDGRMVRTVLAKKSPGCPLHGQRAQEAPY